MATSLETTFQTAEGNILAAYNAAQAKGASMPGTKNSANLAATIASIPQEGVGGEGLQIFQAFDLFEGFAGKFTHKEIWLEQLFESYEFDLTPLENAKIIHALIVGPDGSPQDITFQVADNPQQTSILSLMDMARYPMWYDKYEMKLNIDGPYEQSVLTAITILY